MNTKVFLSVLLLFVVSLILVDAEKHCSKRKKCKNGCYFKKECIEMSKKCCSSLKCPKYCTKDKCYLPETTEDSSNACPTPYCLTPCATVRCTKDTVCTIKVSRKGKWEGAACLNATNPCESFDCKEGTRCYFNCYKPPCDDPYTIQCVDVDPCRKIVCNDGYYCDYPRQKCVNSYSCPPVKGKCFKKKETDD